MGECSWVFMAVGAILGLERNKTSDMNNARALEQSVFTINIIGPLGKPGGTTAPAVIQTPWKHPGI